MIKNISVFSFCALCHGEILDVRFLLGMGCETTVQTVLRNCGYWQQQEASKPEKIMVEVSEFTVAPQWSKNGQKWRKTTSFISCENNWFANPTLNYTVKVKALYSTRITCNLKNAQRKCETHLCTVAYKSLWFPWKSAHLGVTAKGE